MPSKFNASHRLDQAFLTSHLEAWLRTTGYESDRDLIVDFVNAHPRVLEKEGWPVIRELALRNAKAPAN